MSKINNELSIVMVSFYSSKMINRCLTTIPASINVIIVNNAIKDNLRSKINRLKNIKILTPSHNLGNGGGFNYGLKKTNSKFVMYLDVDTLIHKKTFDKLLLIAKTKKNWGIIAPNIKNYKYKTKYILKKTNNNILEMNFVEGCALLFNIKEINHLGYYDQKFFLYYEEDDIFFKYLKNKKKILLIKDCFISHIGNSSVNKKYEFEIELNRNWHLMWSKFYYFKKNYSYLFAVIKTFRSLISSLLKLIIYKPLNKKKYKIYLCRFSGLINSYLGKPSWRRPNI